MSRDEFGFSLVEVLIAVAIMGVVGLVSVSMFSAQQKQMRAMSQKQEMLELRDLITAQFAKPEVCTWQLKDKVIDVSSTTPASASPTTINIDKIYQGLDTNSLVLAAAGQPLPSSLNNVAVDTMRLKDIYATGNPDEYKGDLEVIFKNESLALPMKPIRKQQIFKTVSTDPLSAKRIQYCIGTNSIRVECATASKRGKEVGAALIYNNFPVAPNVTDVFTIHEYPGGEAPWGLSCREPFVPTLCGEAELGSQGTMGPDLWAYGSPPGCFSDNEELGGGGHPTVFLTCCRFILNN